MIVVGEKEKLALAFEPITLDGVNSDGSLFIYLNGVRFGDDTDCYSHYFSIENVLTYFGRTDQSFTEVFNCSGYEILDSVYEYTVFDHEDSKCTNFQHSIQLEVPSFLDIADDLDNCVFRYVPYAFDDCFIVIVPNGDQIKICIRDLEKSIDANTVTTYDEFYQLWVELKCMIECLNPLR